MRDLLEAARRVEARGELVGERLVVDEAVGVGRADGLFVKMLGVELAAFDPRDLRADQRGAVLEVLRAILRPDLELSVVGGQSLEMLLALARQLRDRRTRRAPARRRSDILPFRNAMAMSRAAVAPSTRPRRRPHSRRRRSAPAACGSSTSTRRAPSPGSLPNGARTRSSSNSLIVEGAECRRQAAERSDQPELRADDGR